MLRATQLGSLLHGGQHAARKLKGGKRAWESTAGSLEERELAQRTEIADAHAYPCGFETLRTSV